MGVIHHLTQLTQHIVELPVQIEELYVQLGHIHHLAGLFPRHPSGLIGCICGTHCGVPHSVQKFSYLVVHSRALLSGLA